MGHTLPAHLGLNDFNAAFFTDNTSVLHAFVFTTVTLIVFGGTKYLRTEETIALRFEGTIIDGFRLFNFSMGPFPNLFR